MPNKSNIRKTAHILVQFILEGVRCMSVRQLVTVMSIIRRHKMMNVEMHSTFSFVVSPGCSHLGWDFLLQVTPI